MPDPYRATRSLLDERSEAEPAVETVLAADEDAPWSFDDVDIDSGTFGELVSRGIVVSESDDYRVADPAAVRAALEGREFDGASEGEPRFASLPTVEDVNPAFVVAFASALVFLFASRVVTSGRVFRENLIVLPGNDPYMYRYMNDQLLAAAPSPWSLSEIGSALGFRATGEPLVHAIGYWMTLLAEGSPEPGAATAIAWLPVLAAAFTGLLVGWMALAITEDERAAVLAVLAVALTPAHALYSSIGFFDHHAFDYAWLSCMAAALVWLARDMDRRTDGGAATPVRDHLRAPGTWLASAAFGLAVAAAALNWDGSPVLLTGVAAYVFFRSGSDLRVGVSPALTAAPVAAGLALASALTHIVHTRAGWQEPAAVYAPALVLGGLFLVVGIAEATRRVAGVSPRAYVAGSLAVVAVAVGLAWRRLPDLFTRLLERAGIVAAEREIAESRRLLSADYGVFFGSVDMFGWLLFVSLPALVWVSWRCVRRHEPRWLVPCGFAWPLLGFAVFEVRFAGELSPFMAVFTAVGVLVLLAKTDLAAPPALFGSRTRQPLVFDGDVSVAKLTYLVGALLLIASLSLFMVPATLDTVAQEDSNVEAIEWMAADAAEHDRPAFVLSRWGRQRLYNYHVFGESQGYSVGAQADMEELLSSTDPDAEYDRFSSGVGYIVLEDLGDVEVGPEQGYARLVYRLGSAGDGVDGVGHYRAQFVSSDGSVVVFTPVPGATIEGEGPPDEELTVETTVSIPGAEFTYTRRVETGPDGAYSVTVAHPGTYDVGNGTATVTETDVREGRTVSA